MPEHTAPDASEGTSAALNVDKDMAVDRGMGDTSVVLFSLLLLSLVAVAGYFLVTSDDSPIVKKGALTSGTLRAKGSGDALQLKYRPQKMVEDETLRRAGW